MSASVNLPQWRSHKVVEAAKIIGVTEGEGLVLFVWHLEGGASVDVGELLATRVPPGRQTVGGYYVRYPDGFQSWSPADAFEDGYTRVAADG